MEYLVVTSALAAAGSPQHVSVRSALSKKGSIRMNAQDKLLRAPQSSHRHAAPSAPWPWVDLDDGAWFQTFLTKNIPYHMA